MRHPAKVRADAVALYRRSGRFAQGFAAGKLRRDPVVLDLLAQGCLRTKAANRAARLLDLGCGQGLLFAAIEAWLPATDPADGDGPNIAHALGIDAAAADVLRGQAMLAARPIARLPAEIRLGDLQAMALPECELVVLLDVLHYLDYAEQERLLARIHRALAPGGRLVLRVGDGAARANRISQAVDRVVARLRGQVGGALSVRPLVRWHSLLDALGFAVTEVRTYRAWSAVNVLLLGDKAT